MKIGGIGISSNRGEDAYIPGPAIRRPSRRPDFTAACWTLGVLLFGPLPAVAAEKPAAEKPAAEGTPATLCPIPTRTRPAPPEGAPNILLIAVDTLRADRLGLYGHDRPTSPHLDRLGEDAWVYERAVAAAPWTTPSFAAVMTGLSPGALGIEGEPLPLPREVETLAEGLSELGYETAGVVSHLYVGRQYGFHRGFDFWDQQNAGGHTYVSSAKVSSLASACLDSLSRDDRPFFLFAHFFDPHYDFILHGEHAFGEPYEGNLTVGKNNFEFLRSMARQGRMTDDDRRHLLDRYDSEVAFTDAHVGRLLDDLRRRGLYEDTAVIFVADHGEMLGKRNPRWIGHTQFLFEELIRVPLVIKLPRSAGPRAARTGRVEDVVSLVDLAPTLLQLAGSSSTDDRSLIPKPGGRVSGGPVFSQTRRWRSLDAVYQFPYKLVVDRKTLRRLLYDLSKDPAERRNLASTQPERAVAMYALLQARQAEEARSAARLAPRAEPTLSREQREALKSLGYIQ